MFVTSWHTAGTGADGGGGVVAVTDPGNITVDDDVYAFYLSMNPSQAGNWLRATNYGFTVGELPDTRAIVGYEARK